MSNLPELKNLRNEDFKNPDENLKSLIATLSRFMSSVYNVLNSGINVQDNLLGEFKDISFTSASIPITITLSSRISNVQAVMVASFNEVANNYVASTFCPGITWRQVDRTIIIYGISGLTASTNYTMRLLIL